MLSKSIQLFMTLIVCAFTLTLEASVIKKTTVEELAKSAEVIVVAKVVNMTNVVTSGDVWTQVSLVVEDSLKGNTRSVEMLIPGGYFTRKGNRYRTVVEGVPEIRMMDRGLFFLSGNSPELYTLKDFELGFWRIENISGKEVMIPGGSKGPSEEAFEFLRTVKRVINKDKQR